MKRIHENLTLVLQRHRIVFWYDSTQEWAATFDAFNEAGVTKIPVRGTEFGAKVTMHKNPESRFLVYVPTPRPPDSENWLLDFLLQGHEYKADRASLSLQEIGLPYELRPVIEAHVRFFDQAKKVEQLKKILTATEDASSLRKKLMAVSIGATVPEIDSILLALLQRNKQSSDEELADPVQELLGTAGLDVPFWKELGLSFAYVSESPTLRDFVRNLFRAANPLDTGVRLNAHAHVFLQQWKDSVQSSPDFRYWAELMERELNISNQLDAVEDTTALGSNSTFPLVERFILHRLYTAFMKESLSAADLLSRLQQRRSSFWFGDHRHGYSALEQAVQLRQLIASAELKLDSLDSGIHRYTSTWYRIDTAYRKFHYHAREYGQVALTEGIAERVDKLYLANFLLPLSDIWGDQVCKLSAWPGETQTPRQTDFFTRYVEPVLSRDQKVCVIISDALRYEIAVELMERLLSENRWKAELAPLIASIPSYTQLGMASLLPGRQRSINAENRTVTVDGLPTAGTEPRREVLAASVRGQVLTMKSDEFMELNTASDARAVIRDHQVVYLYHNIIDDTGDKLATEAQTTGAVEDALESLLKLIKKVVNANASQVLLTADHGFLFQQFEVEEADDLPLPPAGAWLCPHRRFALGRDIKPTPGVKLFEAPSLGLADTWQAAFPLALGRFPLKGSGKRFVHGGISLQEVVVPVLRIHKSRTDDTEKVEVDLVRAPSKITTGRISIALYQEKPTAMKVLPRTLRVGVHTLDGTAISELKTLVFNSADPEARQRESIVELALSRAADPHNGKEVEIRIEELAGASQSAVPYKTHRLKLQKPFASDFDEL